MWLIVATEFSVGLEWFCLSRRLIRPIGADVTPIPSGVWSPATREIVADGAGLSTHTVTAEPMLGCTTLCPMTVTV